MIRSFVEHFWLKMYIQLHAALILDLVLLEFIFLFQNKIIQKMHVSKLTLKM